MKAFAGVMVAACLLFPSATHAETTVADPVASTNRVVALITQGKLDDAKSSLMEFATHNPQLDEIFSVLAGTAPSFGTGASAYDRIWPN